MALFSISSLLAFSELLVSFAALITKKLTDSQGEQVYKRNQKLSTEWSLLNNLNWSQAGNDFSILAYGGYTLIAGAFLLSRIIADTYGTCEKILLYCGVIFFLTEACLVFGTLEYIPMDIQVNALVLGTLSAAGAILFFIDLHHQSSLIKSVAQIDAKSLLAKNVPSVLQKSSIQLKPSVPANVQIYPAGCREYLKPQGGKLKARVLQTDV